MSIDSSIWTPSLWRKRPIALMPFYGEHWGDIVSILKEKEALVTPEEIKNFSTSLIRTSDKRGFFLQMGDCAETFGAATQKNTLETLQFFHKILNIIEEDTPILFAGRIAGQFAKPRSKMIEEKGTERVLSYQGDLVNSVKNRSPDPVRMLRGYEIAKKILTWIRSFSLRNIFISHEAYLLPYEEGLTRFYKGGWYATSAHTLWIGKRTNQSRYAHAIFAAGVRNMFGIKIGPFFDLPDLMRLVIDLKRPVLFIVRLGCDKIREQLPILIDYFKNMPIFWVCDPMHGNTEKNIFPIKTRNVKKIEEEIECFFEIFLQKRIMPFGLHIETTVRPVYECLDENVTYEMVASTYESACDPRLNAVQTQHVVGFARDWFLLCKEKI